MHRAKLYCALDKSDADSRTENVFVLEYKFREGINAKRKVKGDE